LSVTLTKFHGILQNIFDYNLSVLTKFCFINEQNLLLNKNFTNAYSWGLGIYYPRYSQLELGLE
jgi:hypothetical protein